MVPSKPLIVAHRGLHTTLPENSLEAMRAAWDAGLQWTECDVHESATGPIFVLHDDTLDRTTECIGLVGDRIDAELDSCRLRDVAGTVTEYRLPRLSDVLHDMPAGKGLLLEVKAMRDHTELVREIGNRSVWVQSFDAHDLAMTSELNPKLPLAYLVETERDLEASLAMPYASVHLEHVLLDDAMHRRLTAAGKSIGVWTVNDEADMRRVMRMGVSVLITDEPHLARRVADEVFGE